MEAVRSGCTDLEDELDADTAGRSHDLGAVADEADDGLKHTLSEMLELRAQLLAQVPTASQTRA